MIRLRLLLAALLALGGEVVLWANHLNRPMIEWFPVLVVYIALAALLLDLVDRYHVRAIFGLLALAGLFGLASRLLINPEIARGGWLLTLLAGALGAHTLVTLLMLTVFASLLRGRITPLLLAESATSGLIWGIYGRWYPAVLVETVPDTRLASLLVTIAIVFTLIALLRFPSRFSVFKPDSLRLSPRGRLFVGLALSAALVWRAAQGKTDPVFLVVTASLIAFVWLILRFQRNRRAQHFVESALPPAPLQPTFALAAVVFVMAGVVGYLLPRGEGESDPLNILGTLFIAFGIVWLPAVSLALGGRALMREIRAQRL